MTAPAASVGTTARLRALAGAAAVGYRARTGRLVPPDIDQLRRDLRALAADDPLRAALAGFVAAAAPALAVRDRDTLAMLGRALRDQALAAMRPAPRWQDRADTGHD
jgi:hypothetical protein